MDQQEQSEITYFEERKVCFSPDSKQIVSVSRDGTIIIWDGEKGDQILSLTGDIHKITNIGFTPDGKRIFCFNSDRSITFWNLNKAIKTCDKKALESKISPDIKRNLTIKVEEWAGDPARDGIPCLYAIQIWDVIYGFNIFTIKTLYGITDTAYSLDGKQIVSVNDRDNTITVWDAEKGIETLNLKGHSGNVNYVAFTYDSKRVVSQCSDLNIKIWDAEKGVELYNIIGNTQKKFAINQNGNRIFSGSKIWDFENAIEIQVLNKNNGLCLAISPDGHRIALKGIYNLIEIYDTNEGNKIFTLYGIFSLVTGVAFSPDGKRIVTLSDDQTIKIWDANNGSEILSLMGHT